MNSSLAFTSLMQITFWSLVDWLAVIFIIIAILLLILIIRLICAIFEMNNNIRDIRKILIKDYNEKHPNDKFREEKPYNDTDYSGMLH